MKILVIGSGAREHALVRALMRSGGQPSIDEPGDPVNEVIVAPGNAGIAQEVPVHPVDVADPEAIADLAEQLSVDLVVIGPELPLVIGAADAVRARGIACFGPSAEARYSKAARLSPSRSWPPPGSPRRWRVMCTTVDEVEDALDAFGAPYVVKDDGLAAGKGVVVTDDREARSLTRDRLPRPRG